MKVIYDDSYNKKHHMKSLIRADYIDVYRAWGEEDMTVEKCSEIYERLHKRHIDWIHKTFTSLNASNEDGVIGVCTDVGDIGELCDYADMVYNVFTAM